MSDKNMSFWGKFNVYIIASRPKTLWAAIIPVLIGSSISVIESKKLNFNLFFIILLTSLLLQILSNFVNDLYDFKKGTDNIHRVGPLRVTQAGLLTEKQMFRSILFLIFCCLILGLYLVLQGGIPILLIGILSIITAIAYTAGPFPIAYSCLGDLFAFIFFGPIAVCGTYYLHLRYISVDALISSIIPGCITTAILVVNNLRDYENDKKSDKKTLAVRFGRKFVRTEYIALLLAAYLVPVYFLRYSCIYLITFLSLPLMLVNIKKVYRSNDPFILNKTLANTGKFLAVSGILFSIAIFFGM